MNYKTNTKMLEKKKLTHKQKSAIKLNIPRRHGAKIDMDIFAHQKDAQK
jgi:hypothetical protein